jgi:tRNA threonylcarbamoyladenosine biosynthesis protein TsaE
MSSKTASSEEAAVVGLSGHLGAGKTAFTKAVGKVLGIVEEITSPTFVLMKQYPLHDQTWKQLIHIDAYRLEKPEELDVLGFEGLVADPDNLIFIEWPENIREALSGISTYQQIRFRIPDTNSDTKNREIIFE